MNKIVPTISSDSTGPLGVAHLPRLWQKVLLSKKGLLPAGYDFCGHGYDQMVLDGLGLDRDETLKFLETSFPTYPEFEAWILKKKGKIDPDAVEKLNAAIRGYNHSDQVRKSILIGAGIQDDGRFKDAVHLNNFDDWAEFHSSLK
jgi:hypothetical protein